MALDMLRRLNADEIIVEILLEQGKVRIIENTYLKKIQLNITISGC